MEYRQLGKSGLKVPELCFGAGTFGGGNEFFKAWAETTQEEANKMVDICMDAGMNLFDTADIYSDGESETVLGKAIAHLKREDRADFDEGYVSAGQGAERCGVVAVSPDPVAGAVAEAAGDGLYRHLPSACVRCDDAGGGDAEYAGQAGARGQGAVHCVLEFFRLASDEVAERERAVWMVAVCGASGVLLAGGARL